MAGQRSQVPGFGNGRRRQALQAGHLIGVYRVTDRGSAVADERVDARRTFFWLQRTHGVDKRTAGFQHIERCRKQSVLCRGRAGYVTGPAQPCNIRMAAAINNTPGMEFNVV